MASFLKRLFGGKDPAPPAPAAAAPPAAKRAGPTMDEIIAECRRNVRALDRRGESAAWAQAQYVLASNLVYAAAATPDHDAPAMLSEAAKVVEEALEAAGPAAEASVLGAMHKLHGEALWRGAAHRFEDEKGRALAEAANAFGAAMTVCPRTADYQVWVDSAFYRGATLQELSAIKGGSQGLAWLDEATRVFTDLAESGGKDGAPHPIAAYNAYVVLDLRAKRTERSSARAYYEEARRYLSQAMDSGLMAAQADYHKPLLAALDATIADLPR